MAKPRIFLGSSGKQAKLLQALTRGLEDVADVEPWTTTFNPGTTTLGRLLELTRLVDFAAFVFAQDDWTTRTPAADEALPGQASPRDNVVFEAGLFGGVLGMRRTFILHASGAKLPTDLLGLTCVRYEGAGTAAETKAICQKLRSAIVSEGQASRVEGAWWQFSLTQRSEKEPSALGLVRLTRNRAGALEMKGSGWHADGTLSARYWSEAVREKGMAPPSSTTGGASARCIPTRRSWKVRARSGWSRRNAPAATSRHVATTSMRGQRASTCVPKRTRSRSWTGATIASAWR